jgi:ribosomal protein L11 methylase PrmA
MPNDEEEQDRLDIHHHIALLHLDGELFLAPIGDNPDQILDLGTGTGIWAMDMGTCEPASTEGLPDDDALADSKSYR